MNISVSCVFFVLYICVKLSSYSDTNFRSEVTLYAIWKAHQYKIVYDLDSDGIPETDEIATSAGLPITGTYYDQNDTSVPNNGVLTIPYPTKAGYVFAGWTITGYELNTAQTGTGQTNSDGIQQLLMLTDSIASKTKNQYFKNLTPNNNATVTFKANWKKIPTENRAIDIIEPSMYGDKVNYNANGVSDWKIFLNGKLSDASDQHVYLIAGDYVENSKIPNASSLEKVGSYGIRSSIATKGDVLYDYLYGLNGNSWDAFVTNLSGAQAYGGPTLKQWIDSWNGKGYTKLFYMETFEYKGVKQYSRVNEDGSVADCRIAWTNSLGLLDALYFQVSEARDGVVGYWLMNTGSNGRISECGVGNKFLDLCYTDHVYDGVRPIIKLSPSQRITWVSNGWDLIN